MANTRIKALISFSDGDISLYVGQIADVETSKASSFIAGGLAVAYTDPINPSGSLNIDANGTYDVTTKASAVVNVSIATLTYNVHGGTGSIDAVVGIKGNSVNLNDGSGITPPDDKVFKGWGETSDATEVLTSPLTLTGDKTIYAVYADTPEA